LFEAERLGKYLEFTAIKIIFKYECAGVSGQKILGKFVKNNYHGSY
jgi:hypothetical protein